MEQADRDLILKLASSNARLKNLYEKHLELEQEVREIDRFARYSAIAAMRQKALKKEKLRGMDTIMSILNEHKSKGETLLAENM